MLLIDDEPPETPTPAWFTRKFAELSMNLAAVGPGGLFDLAQLACGCRRLTVAPRQIRSVIDLDPAASGPEAAPVLVPSMMAATDELSMSPGVVTIGFEGECLLWVPGSSPAILHLAGPAWSWWMELMAGLAPVATSDHAAFVRELATVGAVRPAGSGPVRAELASRG
jgi:hypothetical protein